jgi:hypothetical protein
MKGKALLFGLNYAHCKEGKLNGCINDVYGIANYIQKMLNIPTVIYTDDIDLGNTSYNGIIKNLYNLAVDSYREDLEFVWIHYSGHGSYQKDTSGDEVDGMDEGLVPSDYERRGILLDDIINHVLSIFNPRTKVLFVCDSCHSGTILDLKYSWNSRRQSVIENKRCNIRAKTILISGCMDNQTSADAYNLLGDYKHIGALTASLLNVLQKSPNYIYDVFCLVDAVRSELRRGNFTQYPCLSTNFDVVDNPSMIPANPTNKRDLQEFTYPQNNMSVVPVQYIQRQPSVQQPQLCIPRIPVQQQVQQVPVQQQVQIIQVPFSTIQVPIQQVQQPIFQTHTSPHYQTIQYTIEPPSSYMTQVPNIVQFINPEHYSIYENVEKLKTQDVYNVMV